jgi:geranylgeranyl pyrophosphate synthase
LTEDKLLEYELLEKEILKIGRKSRKKHREIFLRNVTHPDMTSALKNVLSYWKYNIRPALIHFSYEAVGGEEQPPTLFAELFSIVGAGIGIHDDIIDRTFEKRDRVTLPTRYGLPIALTIGDLLIVKGLTSIREALTNNYDKEIVYKILEIYESFFTEMCVGEVMEIKARKNLDMSLKEYHNMLWKLGVDLETCMKIGAIAGKGTKKELDKLTIFGRNFGYLCRLHDEIDDVINIRNKLFYRIEFESIPLLILYASKESNKNYKIISEILNNNLDFEELAKLLAICINSGSFDYVKNFANQYKEKSIMLLNSLGDNHSLNKLKLICLKLNQDIQKKMDGK